MGEISGYCIRCGAPINAPTEWLSVGPPPLIPTCLCWNTSNQDRIQSFDERLVVPESQQIPELCIRLCPGLIEINAPWLNNGIDQKVSRFTAEHTEEEIVRAVTASLPDSGTQFKIFFACGSKIYKDTSTLWDNIYSLYASADTLGQDLEEVRFEVDNQPEFGWFLRLR